MNQVYFKPIVDMTPGIAGTSDWTVQALVVAPDGSYSAKNQKIIHAWPDGYVGIPEVEPLQLIIEKSDGVCSQNITAIEFEPTSVSPNGKYSVVVFCIMDGEILGVTSVPFKRGTHALALAEKEDDVDGLVYLARANAWRDNMPGPGKNGIPLFVSYSLMVPSAGYSFTVDTVEVLDFVGQYLSIDITSKPPKDPMYKYVELHQPTISYVDTPTYKLKSVIFTIDGSLQPPVPIQDVH